MAMEEIQGLIDRFERIKLRHQGHEVWSGRDLMVIFGFKSWQKFRGVIERAVAGISNAGKNPGEHVIQVDELIVRGNGASGSRQNIYLTRFGALMTVQEISASDNVEAAFAKTYFSIQTRRMEVLQQEIVQALGLEADQARLEARQKNREAEKAFQDEIWHRGVDGEGIRNIRGEGDKAFFGGKTTEDMRWKLGIGGTQRALADFLPSTLVLAKALVASMTRDRVRDDDAKGVLKIGAIHVGNSRNIRKGLIDSGIIPEQAEPEEDLKAVEKRLKTMKKLGARSELVPAVPGDPKVIPPKRRAAKAIGQGAFMEGLFEVEPESGDSE